MRHQSRHELVSDIAVRMMTEVRVDILNSSECKINDDVNQRIDHTIEGVDVVVHVKVAVCLYGTSTGTAPSRTLTACIWGRATD